MMDISDAFGFPPSMQRSSDSQEQLLHKKIQDSAITADAHKGVARRGFRAALALATDAASTSKNGIAAPNIVPLSPVGNVAAVQGTNGDTRLYSQNPDNTIQETAVSSTFNGGGHFYPCARSGFVVQPGNKVLYAIANDAAGSPATLRVGFVSAGAPATISEADFSPAKGWQVAQLPS
ncbi:hypothetical protein GGX14DRAFT_393104 [Mycena pura]|uniref:Uncharacterized protein n=1 Tax=Mycena pura TaxID=153505 RepID=A0AAD6VQQ1_9AGAR|nr:hypothetical protein GGX14DRAFT_393104 [Mycena pura]